MFKLSMQRHTAWSIALHVALLLMLSFLTLSSPKPTPRLASKGKAMKAVAVDAAAVTHEIARIQQAEQQKKAQAKRRRIQQQRRERLARQRRLKAAKQLKQLRQKQLAIKRQVAATKRQQAKAKQALEASQRKLQAAREQQKRAEAKARQQAVAKQKAQAAAQQRANLLAQQSTMDRYKAMIVEKIAHNWVLPKQYKSNVSCRLMIELGAGGEVLDAKILKGSGYPVLDASARAAVLKASPLPLPNDPALSSKFKVLRLTVRPETLQNL